MSFLFMLEDLLAEKGSLVCFFRFLNKIVSKLYGHAILLGIISSHAVVPWTH